MLQYLKQVRGEVERRCRMRGSRRREGGDGLAQCFVTTEPSRR